MQLEEIQIQLSVYLILLMKKIYNQQRLKGNHLSQNKCSYYLFSEE